MNQEICFPSLAETSVYINQSNSLTIRQMDENANECLIILETKERARLVAEAVMRLLEVAEFSESSDELSLISRSNASVTPP
jgi:hypothetical protein